MTGCASGSKNNQTGYDLSRRNRSSKVKGMTAILSNLGGGSVGSMQ